MILYYLLYKTINTDIFWQVTVNKNYYELYESIKNFESDSEIYYIVKKNIKNNYVEKELERKPFHIFKIKKSNTVIMSTQNLCKICKINSEICSIL